MQNTVADARITDFNRKKCGEHSVADYKFYWTSVLLSAQDMLAHSIGTPEYFAADKRIREARRELRRLDREGAQR